jgi:hypothetical protein
MWRSYRFCDLPVDEKWVKEQLAAGNEAAWFDATCTATVTVDGQEFLGQDFLGACAYNSYEEFEQDDYSSDMKNAALAELVSNLRSHGYNAYAGSPPATKGGLSHNFPNYGTKPEEKK